MQRGRNAENQKVLSVINETATLEPIDKPEPKFKVGQIVVMNSIRKQLPFRIVSVVWVLGDWFYGWNSRNAVAESSIRKLTPEEVG